MSNPYNRMNEDRSPHGGAGTTEVERLLILTLVNPDVDRISLIERLIEHSKALAFEEGREAGIDETKDVFQLMIEQIKDDRDFYEDKYYALRAQQHSQYSPKPIMVEPWLMEIVVRHGINQKIHAIKEIREKTILGLKDSKDIVDAVWAGIDAAHDDAYREANERAAMEVSNA